MRKIYLAFLLCLSAYGSQAQIAGADTVCKGAVVSYSTSESAATQFAWVDDTVKTMQTGISGNLVIDLKTYGLPMSSTTATEGGNYYTFVAMRLGHILRLDFGNNPFTVPVVTDLGDFGELADSTNGIDVVQEGSNWYGFVVSNKKLVRLDFGPTLTAVPTATAMAFNPFQLGYPYQITVKKYGTEWIAFVANRSNNNLTRFDFGTTLTSTPTATNIGNGAYLGRPTAFTLYNQAGTWYMLVVNMGTGGGPGGGNEGLARLDFGPNLKNDFPSGNSLGRLSNKLSSPRGISLIADCNELYALVSNDNGKLWQLDFKNDITTNSTSIIGTDLGKLSLDKIQMSGLTPFWYADRLNLMAPSLDDSVLYVYSNVYTMPAGSQVSNSAVFSKTMNFGGNRNITLHADQGSARGPVAQCKKTYVINTVVVALTQNNDTLIASGTVCDYYEWKYNGVIIPGVTSRTYATTKSGVYTCTGFKANCTATSNYYFEALSVKTAAYNSALRVYPNPSADVFNVELNGLTTDKTFTVNCYNAIGTLVATQTIHTANGTAKTKIDLSGLPKGAYQLKLQANGEGSMVRQVVLQ